MFNLSWIEQPLSVHKVLVYVDPERSMEDW